MNIFIATIELIVLWSMGEGCTLNWGVKETNLVNMFPDRVRNEPCYIVWQGDSWPKTWDRRHITINGGTQNYTQLYSPPMVSFSSFLWYFFLSVSPCFNLRILRYLPVHTRVVTLTTGHSKNSQGVAQVKYFLGVSCEWRPNEPVHIEVRFTKTSASCRRHKSWDVVLCFVYMYHHLLGSASPTVSGNTDVVSVANCWQPREVVSENIATLVPRSQ